MKELYMTRNMLVNFADDMDNGFMSFMSECEKTAEIIHNEDVDEAMCKLSHAMHVFQEVVNKSFIDPYMSVFDMGVKAITVHLPTDDEEDMAVIGLDDKEDLEYKIQE